MGIFDVFKSSNITERYKEDIKREANTKHGIADGLDEVLRQR